MPRALVLQHVACEHLGLLAPLLTRHAISYRYVRPFLGEPIPPDAAGYDAVIVLGGPMSANDDDRNAVIRDELRLIGEALKADRPLLGICLGAQLIAKAAGARISVGTHKEIGW